MNKRGLYVLSLSFLVLIAACAKKEEQPTPTADTAPAPAPPAGVNAAAIDVGKAVGPDKKVTTPSETFAKSDTIYTSVDTTGAGTATLKATWTYRKDGQATVVNEESQTIMPTGPATTEFHISKPGGWPAGEYQVEVFLDGKSVGVKNFKVG